MQLLLSFMDNKIFNYLNDAFNRLPDNALNNIFILIILYFFLSFLILLVFILVRRIYSVYLKRRKRAVFNYYQNILSKYIFDESYKSMAYSIFSKAESAFDKDILIDVLYNYHIKFEGAHQKILKTIYKELQLNQLSFEKLKSKNWTTIVKGIQEISEFNIKAENKKILDLLNHKNNIISFEAQLASIKLLPFVPFAFLDNLERPFTKWEQINVYDLIKSKNIEVPDFRLWLNSKNDTIVEFCLKMIQIQKQYGSEKEIIDLLDHKNQQIRKECIKTIGVLDIKSANELLIKMIPNEDYIVKCELIKAIHQINEKIDLNLYTELLNSNNYSVKKEICYALRDNINYGPFYLAEIYEKTDDDILRQIIKHVFDSKIKV